MPNPEESPIMSHTLKRYYEDDIVPLLMQDLGLTNRHQVPRLVKVVINIGLGETTQNNKALESGLGDLERITGQKPIVTRAKKSIASFKVRQGMAIGAKVTLRGARMYDFMAKLTGIVMPRIRDFRGLNANAFDGRGNYNIGIRDQLVFPEIEYDKIDKVRGMNITVVTSASTDMEARKLLEAIGMPFRKKAAAAEAPAAGAA
jgi:large subunit ribosomal protein L5